MSNEQMTNILKKQDGQMPADSILHEEDPYNFITYLRQGKLDTVRENFSATELLHHIVSIVESEGTNIYGGLQSNEGIPKAFAYYYSFVYDYTAEEDPEKPTHWEIPLVLLFNEIGYSPEQIREAFFHFECPETSQERINGIALKCNIGYIYPGVEADTSIVIPS